MNLYRKLSTRPFIFHQITGVSLQEFAIIIRRLRPVWKSKHLKKKKIAGRPYGIESLENQLLCLLLYYRTYATQLFIGFWFRVDEATVSRTRRRLEPMLAKVMEIKKEPKIGDKELNTLLLDATEQTTTGSKKAYFSGKKKRYTIKTEIVTTKEGKIIQVSDSFPGSVHDITIRRKSEKLPSCLDIYADGAYRGLEKEYPNILLPVRKKRAVPLSEEEKRHNKYLELIRNSIERKFREMKIFQIFYQTYRNAKHSHAIKVAIIAGIVNLKSGF